MNIFAFIVMALAVIVFVAAHLGVQRKWATVPLGLALAWFALMLQLLIETEHLISINWD